MSFSPQQTDILNKFSEAWSLRFSDAKKAITLSKSMLKESEKINFEQGTASALLVQNACSFFSSDETYSLPELLNALSLFKNSSYHHGIVRCENIIGNVYESFGEYEKALTHCQEGQRIADEHEFKEELADIFGTTGLIYFRLSDFESALKYYQKSLKLRELSGNKMAAASSLNQLARTHSMLGNYDQALSYYNYSLKSRQELSDVAGLPWTYIGLASLFEKQNKFNEALAHYELALEANKSLPDKRCDLHCYLGMGKIFLQNNNSEAAIEILKKALAIATSLKAKPLEYEVHKVLGEAFEQSGNLTHAIEHLKKYNSLKEEVLNTDIANRLRNQQISFAVERAESEAEIERLKNVELKHAYNIIEQKNKDITASITYASLIQKAILPTPKAFQKILPDSFVLYIPKDIVSGDFFWLAEADSKIIVIIADCTGHGVPGAFMSMIGTDQLNHIVYEKNMYTPSAILTEMYIRVQHILKQNTDDAEANDGMEMSVCVIDKTKKELTYAGAMRPLVLGRQTKETETALQEIKPDKHSIGGKQHKNEISFTDHNVSLQAGDSVFMFSDGMQDQFGGPENKKFSSKRLKELLLSVSNSEPQKQKKIIAETFDKWRGENPQTDDVILFGWTMK